MAISGSESVYCCTVKSVGRKWVGQFTRNKQLIHSGLRARDRHTYFSRVLIFCGVVLFS